VCVHRAEFHPDRTTHMESPNRQACTLLIEVFAATETVFTRKSQILVKYNAFQEN
jgi:hypothetical protein